MMNIREFIIISFGEGLFLRLPYADNGRLSKRRTFLTIGEEGNYILLLNVSTTRGKENKLLYSSNQRIIKYNPPFKWESFVKLDSIYKVEKCPELFTYVVDKDNRLDYGELSRLIGLSEEYRALNDVEESITTAQELRTYLTQMV